MSFKLSFKIAEQTIGRDKWVSHSSKTQDTDSNMGKGFIKKPTGQHEQDYSDFIHFDHILFFLDIHFPNNYNILQKDNTQLWSLTLYNQCLCN